MGRNSRLIERALCGGTVPSMHIRKAWMLPSSAISRSFEVSSWDLPSSNCSLARATLFRLPYGRPDALPLAPFLNCPLDVRFESFISPFHLYSQHFAEFGLKFFPLDGPVEVAFELIISSLWLSPEGTGNLIVFRVWVARFQRPPGQGLAVADNVTVAAAGLLPKDVWSLGPGASVG
jgi:hypothetical protein